MTSRLSRWRSPSTGSDYREGVDLDADGFYAQFATAAAQGLPAPVVTTAAPSPGQFTAAYEALASRGATEILSVPAPTAPERSLGPPRRRALPGTRADR